MGWSWGGNYEARTKRRKVGGRRKIGWRGRNYGEEEESRVGRTLNVKEEVLGTVKLFSGEAAVRCRGWLD
jgi:hypothetical protein